MRAPEWEVAALIGAPVGTEVTIAGEVWRKVSLGRAKYWRSEAGERSLSLGLVRRLREAWRAEGEG